MTDPIDHPALERLARLERAPRLRGHDPKMGYQPSLDGVRAMSVIAVILYHGGFSWMHGGFFGVEVFFVVSGFLITSLLIEERDRHGAVNLGQFWIRRWRRLLPALFAMLVVVGVWAVFRGSSEQHTQLRHDYPWGIFYLANWGQIFSKVAYFSGTPTLFRHLWSLAVEEQWYLIWPVVFIVIAKRSTDDARRGRTLVFVSLAVMVGTAIAYSAGWPTRFFNPFRMQMQPVDHVNFLYLSTFTRSSGLVLGGAMAFLWRPWKVEGRPRPEASKTLGGVALLAVVALLGAFFAGHVASGATYMWMLSTVTIASAALVGVVVHPWAGGARAVFGSRPMVEIGKRSYGLYLWTWPISRICNAYTGSWSRFALAMLIAIPISEACYRWVETPIRRGALARWWADRSPPNWTLITACGLASVMVLAVPLLVFYHSAPPVFDAALDTGTNVSFDAGAALGTTTTASHGEPPSTTAHTGTTAKPGVAVTTTATVAASSASSSPTTVATLPRRLEIVGDSTAYSLFRNSPAGLGGTFSLIDGSVEGCSVYDSGTAVSSRPYTRSFGGCAGWQDKWARAARARKAQVALVVLGAWDVFDVKVNGQLLPFGGAANDERFLTGLQKGIDTLTAAGAKVGLLEIPCMRPQDVKGAGVPALAERGDDARVAHLNQLMRRLAAKNAATTTFVTGPQQYCTDPTIASSRAYRWDGVHPFKPGANLTFEAIARQLLTIPVG
ncbi:MAG: acyltransferase family protein [Actinomycetota bacterium]